MRLRFELLLLFLKQYVKVCKSGRVISVLFRGSLLVEFLYEEKSSLLKFAEQLKETKTLEHANFICAVIYSFSSKHEFRLK